jgi:hypothetical protein
MVVRRPLLRDCVAVTPIDRDVYCDIDRGAERDADADRNATNPNSSGICLVN